MATPRFPFHRASTVPLSAKRAPVCSRHYPDASGRQKIKHNAPSHPCGVPHFSSKLVKRGTFAFLFRAGFILSGDSPPTACTPDNPGRSPTRLTSKRRNGGINKSACEQRHKGGIKEAERRLSPGARRGSRGDITNMAPQRRTHSQAPQATQTAK